MPYKNNLHLVHGKQRMRKTFLYPYECVSSANKEASTDMQSGAFILFDALLASRSTVSSSSRQLSIVHHM